MEPKQKHKLIFSIIISFFLFLVFFYKNGYAQEIHKDYSYTGGMGFFKFGSANIHLNALKNAINENEYPQINEGFSALGGAGFRVIDNIVLGAGGSGLIGITNEDQRANVQLNGAMGLAYLGYIFYQKEKLQVYPVIGLGLSSMNLRIKSNINPGSFDSFLNSPFREGNIINTNMILNLELNADYFLTGFIQQGMMSGWLGGLSVGYLISPFKSTWTMNGLLISGSPETRVEGFYFTLKLGGGRFNISR